MPKKSKKLKLKFKKLNNIIRNWPIILMVMGFLLVGYWGIHKWLYLRALIFTPKEELKAYAATATLPQTIAVPGKFEGEVEALAYGRGGWLIADDKVTYWRESGRLGEAGNGVYYGHNKWQVLGKLRQVKAGDEVIITDEQGKEFRYRVEQVVVVSPKAMEWLEPTETEVITVYTCTGWWDSQRLVVRAHRI